PVRRLAEPFERLRDRADAHLARTGRRPQLFLACLGDTATHLARTTFLKNFLAAGGIEAVASAELHNSTDAGKAFADSNTTVAAISGSDTVYAELAEATAGALKAAGAVEVWLAARPGPEAAALQAAGVDGYVFSGSDRLATLTRLHQVLDVQP
ncbi:MAG TPA: methylmalonyl-CoA mutase, partial [Hyphomicrobiaceae bacterium]|nr:methylmalonyl-CoA mutase [Hyphomicrobiaceae bacterium]